MDKYTFLATLRPDESGWEALLSQIAREHMTTPGVAGNWSMKDIVAHITWHEREMVGVLQAHALVGSPLWDLPLHQRNAAIYEQNRQRGLDDVLADAQSTFGQVVSAIELVSDDDLADPGRFPGIPPTGCLGRSSPRTHRNTTSSTPTRRGRHGSTGRRVL